MVYAGRESGLVAPEAPIGRVIRGLMLIHDVLTPGEMKNHAGFL